MKRSKRKMLYSLLIFLKENRFVKRMFILVVTAFPFFSRFAKGIFDSVSNKTKIEDKLTYEILPAAGREIYDVITEQK